jgi:hypothetical protein
MPAQELNVELYDLYVGDWPDEMDFYQAAAAQAYARGEAVLEVACGTLIVHLDHQDLDWLGEIDKHPFKTVRYGDKLTHPVTGQIHRMSYAWAYERATQTATFQNAWEVLDANDAVMERYDNEPVRLHCVFRQEMEHLARRAGFEIDAVYGDFSGHDLQDDSEEMIWVLSLAVASASQLES